MALVAPPCLSLGSIVMMCAPAARVPGPSVPVATRISYAESRDQGYGGVTAYATPITAAQLREFGPPNPVAVRCWASECVGLATVDGFQYPALSRDHGRTWRNAGHWFAGAWADAAAFATRLRMLSPSVFVAWPDLHGVYVTTDAGRAWYAVATPGAPVAATLERGSLTLEVRADGRVTRFAALGGGARWAKA